MKKPKLAYFGHHKAGSTWILRVLNQVCAELGLKHSHFHSAKMFDYDLKKKVDETGVDFFSYTSADFDYVKPFLPEIKGFHVIRDPRDVVVSAYFSHLHSHPTEHWSELVELRAQLEGLSKDEGLQHAMETIDSVVLDERPLNALANLENWDYSQPNIMEIKFEELVANPYKVFLKILKFLGVLDDSEAAISIMKQSQKTGFWQRLSDGGGSAAVYDSPKHQINLLLAMSIIYKNDFEFITKGRKVGEEDVKHHFRKGVPGDWKNHFNEEHKRYFKERYKGLLEKLGYAADDNW